VRPATTAQGTLRPKEIRVLRLPHRLAAAAGILAALAGVLVAGGRTPAGAMTARSRATLYTVTFRGTNLAGRRTPATR
jgi:hypothetical protein